MKRSLLAIAVLAAAGATFSTVASAGDGGPFKATLEPGQEVAPFVGADGASGSAKVVLKPGKGQVCVDVATSGFELVAAHVHEGPAGANGPIVVDLTALVDQASDTADGCVPADRALIREILADPADYYVNVHTDPITVAIRGQLG